MLFMACRGPVGSLSLILGSLLGGDLDWEQLTSEGDQLLVRREVQVRTEHLRDADTLWRLVVLQNGAKSASGRAQSAVEHVNVRLDCLVGDFALSVTDLHAAGLVICAVGAADNLLVLVVAREPRFDVVLLCCRFVEASRDDADHLEGNTKLQSPAHEPLTPYDSPEATYGLEELFRVSAHLLVSLLRELRLGDHELLDLLELVDAEDPPSLPAAGACFLAEASGVASIVDGELLRAHPLATVVSRDGLF